MDVYDYNNVIREILNKYYDYLESEKIPLVKESFSKLFASFTELHGKLRQKGLIKDDPYANSNEVIEIIIPDFEPYIETEEAWKTDSRFNQYISVLSFIVNNYNLNIENLDMNEIEKINKFIQYYDLKNIINPLVTDFNTTVIGKKIISLRASSSDRLITSTFDSCIDTIYKCYDRISDGLKYIFLFLKESYKLYIRNDILTSLDTNINDYSPEDLLKKIKNEIDINFKHIKFYKKYVLEIIEEDFSPQGEGLRDDILKKLSFVNTEKSKKKEKENSGPDKNEVLLKLLLEMGKIRPQLSSAIEKINDNHLKISSVADSFFSKFLKMLSRALFNLPTKTIYNLSFRNTSGEKQNINLHYEEFYDYVKHIEYLLLPFSEDDRAKSFIQSLSEPPTKEIDKIILGIKKSTKNLAGLDEYFKLNISGKIGKSRGIKPELNALKSQIGNCSASYRDYLDLL
jgi:hypothetical protein